MNLSDIAKQLGQRGGLKTKEKYTKEQRKVWGKKGGRPKSLAPSK